MSEPAVGTSMIGAERLDREAKRAMRNCCQSLKRSLLDFVDTMHGPVGEIEDPRVRKRTEGLLEKLSKRIHNDVSMLDYQAFAILEIVRNGGNIPPFGQRDEGRLAGERKPDEARSGLAVQTGPGGMPELIPKSIPAAGPVFNGVRVR